MATSSKKTKTSTMRSLIEPTDDIDRISKLPDSVLCEILSFLPTKLAASTTILSKRWRFLWTSVPNLDLEGDYSQDFAHVVNTVLALRRERCIRRFRLVWPSNCCDSFNLDSWVSAAIARDVQELNLELLEQVALPCSLFDSETLLVLKLMGCGQSMDVPSSAHLPNLKTLHLIKLQFRDEDSSCNLFRACPVVQELVLTGTHPREKNLVKFIYCDLNCFLKLVTLKLSNGVVWSVASNVHFPSLKILHLKRIIYENENSVLNLFTGCPVLEELYVDRYYLDNILSYEISSPTLTKLNLVFLHSVKQTSDDAYSSLYTVRVNAPALKCIRVEDYGTRRLYIENTGSSIEATVCNSIDLHILEGLCNVTSLKLQRTRTRLFCNIDFFDKVPEFHTLVELTLTKFCCHGVLLHMLQKFPCLERLTLAKGIGLEEHEEECRTQTAIQLSYVPNCLALHLRTFCLFQFEGLEVEMEFMRYILKNSLVLEEMRIRTKRLKSDTRFEILQKLAMFGRGSKKCQLWFE